jgi:hypothetical protein
VEGDGGFRMEKVEADIADVAIRDRGQLIIPSSTGLVDRDDRNFDA